MDPIAACELALERAQGEAARHAFVTLTPDRAREEARASAERHRAGRALGPLDGVPIAWKDLVDVAGTTTTAGSALRRDLPPAERDAPVVARLAAAGMVCVGKTNLSELAYSGLGLNPHFGTPRNPRSPAGDDRVPGGSSSGSAVAVAAGVVECAIGTDTSGSIRVPAAFCGLVGFKPTSARVDRTGVFALSETLDGVGPLTTSVAMAGMLDAALRGLAPRPPAATPPERLRLVVPAGEASEDLTPGVARAFADALARLTAAGARVEHAPLPAFDAAIALMDEHGTLVAAEAYRAHAALVNGPDADRLDHRVRDRLRGSRAVFEHGYLPLLEARAALQRRLAAELGPDGLMLCPAVRHVAPAIAPLDADPERFARVNLRTLRTTMPASYLDMPGVSLPMGPGEDGLPTGLLVSGAPGTDDDVLVAAQALERVLEHHRR